MAIGIRVRLLYTSLVSLTFILSLIATIMFELTALDQTKISAQSGMLLTILLLLRVMNYLLTLTTFCVTITTLTASSESPAVPFGLAFATVMLAIFSVFFVFEFKSSAYRYETETLKTFSLRTKENRDVAADQLTFLDSYQPKMKCCGLNGYQDFAKNKYTANRAIGDEVDLEDTDVKQIDTKLTWTDFLTGANVNYTFTDHCGINGTKTFGISAKTLSPSEDVPLSCCKSPKVTGCNKNVFNATTSNINTKGCSGELLKAIRKVNTTGIHVLLFAYPWIVAVFGMIVTWTFVCDIRGQPFKVLGFYLFWKPKKADPAASTQFQTESDVAPPPSATRSRTSGVESLNSEMGVAGGATAGV